jgi:uncharacterized damage-inducible protein DinB
MIPRQPWFERRFTFDLPVTAAPGQIERLRGTPARLEHRLRGIAVSRLTARWGNHWSIQENVGHLWDVEPLWMARINDFFVGRLTLQVADLENRKTHEANHNGRPLADLLAGFAAARAELVTQLEAADEADWLRSAKHPRLQTAMRLLDHAFFVAEHDDHHLATITELLRRGDS